MKAGRHCVSSIARDPCSYQPIPVGRRAKPHAPAARVGFVGLATRAGHNAALHPRRIAVSRCEPRPRSQERVRCRSSQDFAASAACGVMPDVDIHHSTRWRGSAFRRRARASKSVVRRAPVSRRFDGSERAARCGRGVEVFGPWRVTTLRKGLDQTYAAREGLGAKLRGRESPRSGSGAGPSISRFPAGSSPAPPRRLPRDRVLARECRDRGH